MNEGAGLPGLTGGGILLRSGKESVGLEVGLGGIEYGGTEPVGIGNGGRGPSGLGI